MAEGINADFHFFAVKASPGEWGLGRPWCEDVYEIAPAEV